MDDIKPEGAGCADHDRGGAPVPESGAPEDAVTAALRAELAATRRSCLGLSLSINAVEADNRRLRGALDALLPPGRVTAEHDSPHVIDLRRQDLAGRSGQPPRARLLPAAPGAGQAISDLPFATDAPSHRSLLPAMQATHATEEVRREPSWVRLVLPVVAVFAVLLLASAVATSQSMLNIALAAVAVALVAAAVWAAHAARRTAGCCSDLADERGRALEHARDRDPVTDLLNRRSFTSAVDRLLALTEAGTSVDLVVVEVDSLRAIGHWLGATEADEVLCELAHRLGGQRGVVAVAHLGDGRFAVLGATRLLDSSGLVRTLAMTLATSCGPIAVSAVAGVRRFEAGHGPGAAQALAEASLAARSARAEGSRVRRFSPAMVDETASKVEDSVRFAAALAGGELSCVWQPVRDPETLTVVGFEALARWEDPQRGMIPTERWVSVARPEDLVRFEAALLTTAATALAEAMPHDDTWVSVNVSAAHLLYFDLAGAVASALDRSGLAPHRLVLEVTERDDIVLADAAGTMSELSRLYGVRFAVDDMGDGYSTLRWLLELPASIVKLDQSLTRSLGTDPAADGLVKAVAQWAADNDRLLIVEGVESTEQYHCCRALGVRAVQGWLVGRPLGSMAEATAVPMRLAAPVSVHELQG
jgi:EAL domain-containing protein (putative c-di-GMP-specific phosphodiesterase class I)/GGDEF domain-containing protein